MRRILYKFISKFLNIKNNFLWFRLTINVHNGIDVKRNE